MPPFMIPRTFPNDGIPTLGIYLIQRGAVSIDQHRPVQMWLLLVDPAVPRQFYFRSSHNVLCDGDAVTFTAQEQLDQSL